LAQLASEKHPKFDQIVCLRNIVKRGKYRNAKLVYFVLRAEKRYHTSSTFYDVFSSEHEIPSLPESKGMHESNSTLQERMLNDRSPNKHNRGSIQPVGKMILTMY
jgi:hypothetical protein